MDFLGDVLAFLFGTLIYDRVRKRRAVRRARRLHVGQTVTLKVTVARGGNPVRWVGAEVQLTVTTALITATTFSIEVPKKSNAFQHRPAAEVIRPDYRMYEVETTNGALVHLAAHKYDAPTLDRWSSIE
jgi:hypothetical protein